MGQLALPVSGVVYVDTAPIIYSVEKHADYWSLLRPLWAASKAGQIFVASGELALLETLVGPLKSGDHDLATDYEQLLTATEVKLLPVTLDTLRSRQTPRANQS